ncbi:hypothetical protein WDU94_008409 [Cyamophila willieti]
MKTKWFIRNIGECLVKDVPSYKKKSESLEEGQKKKKLPEPFEIQNLVEDLLWEDGLHEKDVCVEVNKQRLQTDDDVTRQNQAIALTLVNYVVQEAEKKFNQGRTKGKSPVENLDLLLKRKTVVKWPTVGEFNITIGGVRIREYVHTWSVDIRWGYCIDLLDIREDSSSRYYIYDVQWCIPSKQHPIPTISVSVYFIYQVCKFFSSRLCGNRVLCNRRKHKSTLRRRCSRVSGEVAYSCTKSQRGPNEKYSILRITSKIREGTFY